MAKRSDARLRSVRRSRRGTSSLSAGLRFRALRFEPLEGRTLLSVAPLLPANWQAQPMSEVQLLNTSDAGGSSSPYGLTPNQVRGAYGLGTYTSGVLSNGISFGGINGDGTGQTIAIVDAYDDPYAASDLNAFSTNFGLPTFGGTGNPTFQKLNQNGKPVSTDSSSPNYVPTDPISPWNGNKPVTWEMEESLDIESAHVMAPMANIILFEASNTGTGLYTAVQTATNTDGVVAISMSWGGGEFFFETGNDIAYFVTPAGHLGGSATMGGTQLAGGITFFASSGDNGAYAQGTGTITPQYPASSPNVVSVGATSLYVNGNNYSSETTWGNGTSSGTSGGGGGGISNYESQPAYQSGVVNSFSTTQRTYPDVSIDANPGTGVPIYDSWDFGASTPWLAGQMGGTSLAAPLWAAIVAVADQGRATLGLGSLDGSSQTLPALYTLAATNFHDITTGSGIGPSSPISYNPGPGYDLATGRGSPVANLLIPQLVGPTRLAFGQPPTSAQIGTVLSPAVTVLVEDSLGNVVASGTSSVTIAIGNNPSGGRLGGTLTVAAVNGVATFNNLSINESGNGYTLIASDTTGSGSLTVTSAAFNIVSQPTAPGVTAEPGDQTVLAGGTVSFVAAASGNPTPSVQWEVNTGSGYTGLSDGGVYSGSSSDTLTITGATAAMNGYQYEAVFSNGIGLPATTAAATLTVQSAPGVTAEPGDQTVLAGGTVSFMAAASGNPTPSVQWEVNTGSGYTRLSDGGVYGGSSSDTLTITGATAAMNGYQYEAVFSNGIGLPATTTAATLTVQIAPSVTAEPGDQTVLAGGTVSFMAAASGNPTPSVQWEVNTGSGYTSLSDEGVYSGSSSDTLTITGATAAMNGYQYEAVFSNGIGLPATTTAATLTVQSAPGVTAEPGDQTVLAGGTVSFVAAASGNPTPSVQWEVNTGSGYTGLSDEGVYSGSSSDTLTITGATAAMNGYQYEAVFSNGIGLPVTTTAATLTVQSARVSRRSPAIRRCWRVTR